MGTARIFARGKYVLSPDKARLLSDGTYLDVPESGGSGGSSVTHTQSLTASTGGQASFTKGLAKPLAFIQPAVGAALRSARKALTVLPGTGTSMLRGMGIALSVAANSTGSVSRGASNYVKNLVTTSTVATMVRRSGLKVVSVVSAPAALVGRRLGVTKAAAVFNAATLLRSAGTYTKELVATSPTAALMRRAWSMTYGVVFNVPAVFIRRIAVSRLTMSIAVSTIVRNGASYGVTLAATAGSVVISVGRNAMRMQLLTATAASIASVRRSISFRLAASNGSLAGFSRRIAMSRLAGVAAVPTLIRNSARYGITLVATAGSAITSIGPRSIKVLPLTAVSVSSAWLRRGIVLGVFASVDAVASCRRAMVAMLASTSAAGGQIARWSYRTLLAVSAVTALLDAIKRVFTAILPNAMRTIRIPGRTRHILVQRRVRHFIVEKDMIHQASAKRPAESPVFSLNIAKEMAINQDTVISVTAEIEAQDGVADTAGMLVGPASFIGAVVSQRVGGGQSGVMYYLKFKVVTTMQELEFVVSIPVTDDGAFKG